MNATHADVLRKVEAILVRAGVRSAARDALAIVGTAGRLTDLANQAMCALAMAAERAAGTPLGHVIGSVQFMGVEVLTPPGTLVPREETELLGWTALGVLNRAGAEGELRLIDMCCGSGNLACGIASKQARVRAWAADLTDDAVAAARKNVSRLQLSGRVDVVQSDLFSNLAGRGLEGTIDAIVCNPPYIPSGHLAAERAELLTHEPRLAFDGGPYGIAIFQRMVREAPLFLKPGGTLLFEVPTSQMQIVSALFERTSCYDGIATVKPQEGGIGVVGGCTLDI